MSPFEHAVRAVAEDLSHAPPGTSGAHVHFDDPTFSGLIPAFSDPQWVVLAAKAARAASGVDGSFLVSVPLGEWETPPDRFDVQSLRQLAPWEPPALHFLARESAYAARVRSGAWHSDDVPGAAGAAGWVGGHFNDESRRWRLSLNYETPSSLG